jgi:hypothetical protein
MRPGDDAVAVAATAVLASLGVTASVCRQDLVDAGDDPFERRDMARLIS